MAHIFKRGDRVVSIPCPDAGEGTVTGVRTDGNVCVTYSTWYGNCVDSPDQLRLVQPVGPVVERTVREIVPGTYDGVYISYEALPAGSAPWVSFEGVFTADQLTRAAAVLTAIAGALRDGQ